MARALAVAVHALFAALVVTAVLLALSDTWIVGKVVIVAVPAALAWYVRPRRPARPAGAVLDRASAPVLFAHLDDLSRGACPVRTVVVDHSTTVGSGPGWVRLGLPVWLLLSARARSAVLAEHVGRLASGRCEVDPLVLSAEDSLGRWQELFRPGSELQNRSDDALLVEEGYAYSTSTRGVEPLLRVLLAPLWLAVAALRAGLSRCRDGGALDEAGRGHALSVTGYDQRDDVRAAHRDAEQLLALLESSLRRNAQADVWALARPAAPVEQEIWGVAEDVRRHLRDAARS